MNAHHSLPAQSPFEVSEEEQPWDLVPLESPKPILPFSALETTTLDLLPAAQVPDLIHPKASAEASLQRVNDRLVKIEEQLRNASDEQSRLIKVRKALRLSLEAYASVIAP